MPIRRSHLNQAERRQHLASAQQLVALKLITEIPEYLENHRALDIVICEPESLVFEIRRGAVGYAIWVRIVARQAGLILTNCRVTTTWDDQILLKNFDAERTPFRKLGWVEYPQADVLNERVVDSFRFHHRGQMIEGMILALGIRPIPDAYRHGMFLPVDLAFLDQFENEFKVDAEIFVDRTMKPKNAVMQPRTGLYGPTQTPESTSVLASKSLSAPQRQSEISGYGNVASERRPGKVL
jgi:hypothetical protein